MSYAPAQLHGCPDIQAELDVFFPTCGHDDIPDPAPLYEFLLSDQNRSGIQQVLMPGENKVRTLILRYDQPLTESQVIEVDGCARQCDATTKRGDLTASYEIDTCDTVRVEEVMNPEDFKLACTSNFTLVTKKIARLIKAIEEKQATRMTQRAITKYGAWQANVNNAVDGGTKTIADNTGNTAAALKLQTKRPTAFVDINPEAMTDLSLALRKTNYCNGAAVFGATILWKYFELMRAGCCSSQGLDIAQIMRDHGYAVMYDRRFENEMGVEYGMTLAPRALQPIWYVRNNNGVADAAGITVGANYQKQVIFGSLGTPIDLTMKDDCENGLSIVLESTMDLVTLPTDIFPPGHHMEGVTWINKLKVANQV